MTPTIFGREPVVISNAAEALLTAALAFHLLNFIGIDSPEEVGTIMAVVTAAMGVYVAYCTHDTLLAASIAFVKACVLLFAVYGYNVTDHQLAVIVTLMTAAAATFHRTQTGPAVEPSLNLSQHSTPIPPTGELTATVPAVHAETGAVTEVAADDGAEKT